MYVGQMRSDTPDQFSDNTSEAGSDYTRKTQVSKGNTN